jgi:predicted metal-dependent HD superfamily phosphohydrolase
MMRDEPIQSDGSVANWELIAGKPFDLQSCWRSLVEYFPKPGAPCGRVARAGEWYDRLATAYQSADRHYHNLNHISQMLLWIDSTWQDTGESRLIATWATIFHDAVYDSRQKDNEERSAAMSLEAAGELQIPPQIAGPAADWILRTKTHDAGGSSACAHFLDCDLAILGAPEDLYRDYAEAIRGEYAWVSDEAYRIGRMQVLKAFLDRNAIYATDCMATLLEASARRNLQNEIERLTQTPF